MSPPSPDRIPGGGGCQHQGGVGGGPASTVFGGAGSCQKQAGTTVPWGAALPGLDAFGRVWRGGTAGYRPPHPHPSPRARPALPCGLRCFLAVRVGLDGERRGTRGGWGLSLGARTLWLPSSTCSGEQAMGVGQGLSFPLPGLAQGKGISAPPPPPNPARCQAGAGPAGWWPPLHHPSPGTSPPRG